MAYLLFNTQAKAEAARFQIWKNAIKEIADEHNGSIIINAETKETALFSSLTDAEIDNLVIFGYKNGQRNYESGFMTDIIEPIKIYNQDKWFFVKPDNYMTNVVFDEEVQEFDENWFEPFDPA